MIKGKVSFHQHCTLVKPNRHTVHYQQWSTHIYSPVLLECSPGYTTYETNTGLNIFKKINITQMSDLMTMELNHKSTIED